MVGLGLAYFVGLSVSSITQRIPRLGEPVALDSNDDDESKSTNDRKDPRSLPQLGIFTQQIKEYFNREFHSDPDSWSSAHFYIARTLIREKLPHTALIADRQNTLRQFRRNSMIPVLIWGCVGIKWGFDVISQKSPLTNGGEIGFIIILSSFVLTALLELSLYKGMRENRRRESREICSGLLVLAAMEREIK